ncbi:MAG: nucleotidyltransferase domain-containing protein [bacterium]
MSQFQSIIWENINELQNKLRNTRPFDNVVSIMVDGSLVRGDFLDEASDIDLTITTSKQADEIAGIVELINICQNKLLKRVWPSKPLKYDIQWQNIYTVRETGKRGINEWSISNIPTGYPRLWLYAFDGVKFHKVIYGDDVTKLYTHIPPRDFVSLRLERLKRSVTEIGSSESDYEKNYGAITQVKNAWETVRVYCLATGLESINKTDVYGHIKKVVIDKELLKTIEMLWSFYHGKYKIENAQEFRGNLYNFSLNLMESLKL